MELFQEMLFEIIYEPIVFLDIETTGLDYYKDEIIEIAAIRINDKGEKTVFNQLLNTDRSLKEKIVKMTGIQERDLKGKPYAKDIIKEFMEFIDNCTIIAHNAAFDISFIAKLIVDYGVMYNDSEVICTFKISEEIKEKNKSLTALCKRYRIESFEAHRALTDVQALERLWDKEYCKYRHKTNGSKLSDFVGEMSSMKVRFPKVFK